MMSHDAPLVSRPLLGTLIVGAVVFGVVIGIRQPPQFTPRPTQTVCEPPLEQDAVARADLIVVGQVFAVVPGPTGAPLSGAGADVLVTVEETLKGIVPDRGVTIAARDATPQRGTASSGELHFASGDTRYLLFLRARTDGRFDTSVCDGSRILKSEPTPLDAVTI